LTRPPHPSLSSEYLAITLGKQDFFCHFRRPDPGTDRIIARSPRLLPCALQDRPEPVGSPRFRGQSLRYPGLLEGISALRGKTVWSHVAAAAHRPRSRSAASAACTSAASADAALRPSRSAPRPGPRAASAPDAVLGARLARTGFAGLARASAGRPSR